MNVFLFSKAPLCMLAGFCLAVSAGGTGGAVVAFEGRAAAQPTSAAIAQGQTRNISVTSQRATNKQLSNKEVSKTLYVDGQAGNDGAAGTFGAPLRTITQAIAAARPGMVIQLSPGTYNAESGEQFPLKIPQGVVLRGSVSSRGKGVAIVGGGRFLSRTQAGQSVAIALGDGATAEGITVSNPNTRGTGIWVEGGKASILSSTFSGSHREGVFLSGEANATVRNNVFRQNGGNGIAITRQSRGVIANNVFDSTGYGIAVGDRAAPLLQQNRVVNNRDGIVISGSAQPTLRGNVIENNRNDGVVVIGQALPDLGTASSPGGNQIQGNGRNAVFNATRGKLQFPFYGNTISGPAPAQVAIEAAPPRTSTVTPTEPVPRNTATTTIPVGETVPVEEFDGADGDGEASENPFFSPILKGESSYQ